MFWLYLVELFFFDWGYLGRYKRVIDFEIEVGWRERQGEESCRLREGREEILEVSKNAELLGS